MWVVAVTLLVPIIDQLWPVPAAHAIGVEAHEEVSRQNKLHFMDGTLLAEIERALLKTSRVRDVMVPPWRLLLLAGFKDAPDSLVMGRDGYLFLSDRTKPDPTHASGQIEEFLKLAHLLNRRLKNLGTELLVVPVPTKAWAHPDAVPRGVNPHRQLYEQLLAGLDRRHVTYVDMLAKWKQSGTTNAFCRGDSHWTWEGAIAAAEAIAEASKTRVNKADRLSTLVRLHEFPDVGDLFGQAEIDELLHQSEAARQMFAHLDRPLGAQTAYRAEFLDGTAVQKQAWNGSASSTALLVGTSFTAWPEFDGYVQHATNGAFRIETIRGGGLSQGLVSAFEKTLENPALHPWPQVLVWEFPVANLWTENAFSLPLIDVLSLLPDPGAQPITQEGPWRALDLSTSQAVGTQHNQLLGTWDLSQVHHQGTGLLSVQLLGESRGAASLIRLGRSNPESRKDGNWFQFAKWRPGLPSVSFPLLRGSGQQMEIRSMGTAASADLQLHRARLTSPPWITPSPRWTSHPGDDHEIVLKTVHPLPELSGLLLHGSNGHDDVTIRAQVLDEKGEVLTVTRALLKSGPYLITLSLVGKPDASPASIVLRSDHSLEPPSVEALK